MHKASYLVHGITVKKYLPSLVNISFYRQSISGNKKRFEANSSDIALAFNPFLNTLGVSHTQIYGIQDTEYYLFRSLFSTKDLDTPKHHHIGIQFERQPHGLQVKSLIEGYSAEKAGLRRDDFITQIDHLKAKGVLNFKGKKVVQLTVDRSGKLFEVRVNVSHESIHRSF